MIALVGLAVIVAFAVMLWRLVSAGPDSAVRGRWPPRAADRTVRSSRHSSKRSVPPDDDPEFLAELERRLRGER